MTMILDNNFIKFDKAIIVILPFTELYDNINNIINNIAYKNYSIIFITHIANINILYTYYNSIKQPSYNYKIIIQVNNSNKTQLISNERTKYNYTQIINVNC